MSKLLYIFLFCFQVQKSKVYHFHKFTLNIHKDITYCLFDADDTLRTRVKIKLVIAVMGSSYHLTDMVNKQLKYFALKGPRVWG